jgi:Transcriptional regulator, AbiEi antitoxin N-terminal domain
MTTMPAGVVLQAFWLAEQGYSTALQQRYRKSHWLQPVGKGAMCRAGSVIGYEGAICALQQQRHSSKVDAFAISTTDFAKIHQSSTLN